MAYLRLIQLVEDHAEEITARLLKDILTREETKGYRILPQDKICERVYDVYRKLGSWLGTDKGTKDDIRKIYSELGAERCREGIPLKDVVMAFMLIKRHIWLFVQEMKFFDSMDEIYQALELNNKVVLFFDMVIYFVTMGYEAERARRRG